MDIIQDARVLQDEFIPAEVRHRDGEMNALSRALDPIMWDEAGETALLVGPSGSGKTCLARFAVERLAEATTITHQYVNCWQDYTRFRALYRITEAIGATVGVHRGAATTDSLLYRLEEYDGPELVVVLDEVDQLHDEAVLADLYRTRGVSMLLIANHEDDFFARLGERLVSRLRGSVRVRFEKYDLDELVAILADRVQWGLAEGVVEHDHLRAIADAAAGDARVAISVLRNAARQAAATADGEMTMAMVEAAIPEAKADIRQKHIDQLQPHQRAVYEVVDESEGAIAPADLYERYRERVDESRANRTVRKYLSKLEHYNLVVKDGEGRNRTYRVPR